MIGVYLAVLVDQISEILKIVVIAMSFVGMGFSLTDDDGKRVVEQLSKRGKQRLVYYSMRSPFVQFLRVRCWVYSLNRRDKLQKQS